MRSSRRFRKNVEFVHFCRFVGIFLNVLHCICSVLTIMLILRQNLDIKCKLFYDILLKDQNLFQNITSSEKDLGIIIILIVKYNLSCKQKNTKI